MRGLMVSVLSPRIHDLAGAKQYVQGFHCPDGFSQFAWKNLQQTALSVWHAHLCGRPYRGALNFCRPEFYAMLAHPDGSAIVPTGQIRGYKAA